MATPSARRRILVTGACAALAAAVGPPPAEAAVTGSNKFIPAMIVYYGGGPALTAADAARLAKYDLIDVDRFRYNQIGGNTWAAIKAVNPNVEIYLYEMGPESQNYMDGNNQASLNGLGRYNVSRGHPMGSLNGNNSGLYLTDGSGNRIYSKAFSNVGANQYWNLMDFGSSAYQSYWVTAVKADIIDQPWKADGVFADNCLTFSSAGGYSATSTKYSSDAAWSNAMNSFASGIAGGLHGYGQKLWCNKGDSRSTAGGAAWRALDASANHPDILMEEGAFGVEWGAAVQFYPEAEWKSQVDTIGAMQNTKVGLMSHTQLAPGETGTDNWGKPVSFYQAFYYAMGSLLVGKNAANNSYLMFSTGTGYNSIIWYDEFDRIDLGAPVANYVVTNVGGVNVYWREFQRGYVAVNPTANNVASFTLPQPVQLITHDNLFSTVSSLPSVGAIGLGGHSAAIMYKTGSSGAGGSGSGAGDTLAPSVPANLVGTAVSPTQVNLTWSASTDNVGVTGYVVYLNDVQLTTTASTSFQHTGLTAGTTYNYRVSAFDAVPNHSAWTATPVSVTPTNAAAGDTAAPSVPSGLTAKAVSPTQVTLSWNASTDNVGVTGYYVYLNDVPLTTVTGTTFQHTGLVAGATYNYRVSAFDAVPNHSAWTAVASATTSTTTAVADTVAPSVPTGLVVSKATSATQITLKWNASTDNVGVKGYYVYVNDQLLTSTTSTSFTHSGLAANTTYNYRVSAFDAVPNNSAWTAAQSARTARR